MKMSSDYIQITIDFKYEISLSLSIIVPADGNICSFLFSAPVLATFGTSAYCFIETDFYQSIIIKLGTNPTLLPGDTLTIQANALFEPSCFPTLL